MVYNRDSVFACLYVAYQRGTLDRAFPGLSLGQAFTRSTDGSNCRISRSYRPAEFVALCEEAGFEARFVGAAVSMFEVRLMPTRFDAIFDRRLPESSCRFLLALTVDAARHALVSRHPAGDRRLPRIAAARLSAMAGLNAMAAPPKSERGEADTVTVTSERVDSVYLFMWPGWREELESNRWHWGKRWARKAPVVFIQPELTEGETADANPESRLTNVEILSIETHPSAPESLLRVGLRQSGQIAAHMLLRGHERPLFWFYNPWLAVPYMMLPAVARTYHATENYLRFCRRPRELAGTCPALDRDQRPRHLLQRGRRSRFCQSHAPQRFRYFVQWLRVSEV